MAPKALKPNAKAKASGKVVAVPITKAALDVLHTLEAHGSVPSWWAVCCITGPTRDQIRQRSSWLRHGSRSELQCLCWAQVTECRTCTCRCSQTQKSPGRRLPACMRMLQRSDISCLHCQQLQLPGKPPRWMCMFFHCLRLLADFYHTCSVEPIVM